MTKTIAVLAGATGLVGRYLLDVLIEDAYYDEVVAIARRPIARSAPKLRFAGADFDDLEPEDLAGATHLFCCLGTTIRKAGTKEAFRKVDYEYVLQFARAGKRAGASRFLLVSSVGAAATASNFYLRVKGEAERDLKAMEWEALHLFRPSLLLGKRDEERPGEQLAARLSRGFEWALVGGLRKYRPMPAGLLANAMAAAGERGGHGVQIYHYEEIARVAGA
jgi:uncharacterized protein YbjT (DUF2867 family)